MSDHDPLCPNVGLRWERQIWCACDLIAKVRADEREKNKPLYTAALMQHMQDRLDLRAKVEALWLTQIIPPERDTYGAAIKDVLALFDGSDDDQA